MWGGGWLLLECRVFLVIVVCGGRAPMCGEGGLRTWEVRAWLLLTLLFRMIPGFLLTRSAHECATSTDRPWHTRAPVEPTHSGEARLIRETTTHWTTTALDAEVDRSRCGVRPISASGGAGRSVIGRHSGAAVTGAPPEPWRKSQK